MDSQAQPTLAYDGKYIDRNPDVKAAGNLRNFGSSVADCLFIAEREPYGYVKRFLNENVHPVGHTTQWPARVNDSCIANKLCHGVPSFPSQPAVDLIYPHQMTTLEYVKNEMAEKLYRENSKAPLGKAPSFDLPDENCRKIVENTESIRDSFHYPQELLVTDDKIDVGQQINRNYNDHFTSIKQFGENDKERYEDGRLIKNIMYENSLHRKQVPVKMALEVYRFKNCHKLGESLQPQCDVTTALLNENHTFGTRKKTTFSLNDEIKAQQISEINNVKQIIQTVLESIKNHRFDKFDSFIDVCKYFDKGKTGRISLLDLKSACQKVQLPINSIQLKHLVEWCGLYSSNNSIDYVKLRTIIDPNLRYATDYSEIDDQEKLDVCSQNGGDLNTEIQKNSSKINQIVGDLTRNQSSGHDINSNIAKLDLKTPRVFGIPMIRSDHPPPNQRGLDDVTNYGDQPDVRSLLYPSIYTRNGLSKEDCLKPRPKDELFEIFQHVDPRMDFTFFDKVWKMASDSSCDRRVSVEGIKNALKSV